MFFLSAESKSSAGGTRSFQKKTNRSAVKSWKTYTAMASFKAAKRESQKSISLGLQTSVFDTSGCRKRSGCFFWGDEWRAQHVMRCGKIVSKKSPPQGWLSMERHNFWRPHPRVGHSLRGIRIGKTANPVGTLTPGVDFLAQKIYGLVWWIQSGSFFVFSGYFFCNFERKNTSGTWNRKRLTDLC